MEAEKLTEKYSRAEEERKEKYRKDPVEISGIDGSGQADQHRIKKYREVWI